MRWKIILPNLIIVLAVGLAGWLYLKSYYTDVFDTQARQTLQRDRNLFIAANQQRAVKFLSSVMARSRRAEVEGVFDRWTDEELRNLRQRQEGAGVEEVAADGAPQEGPTDDELMLIWRNRAYQECQAFRAYLGQDQVGGRTPEIVAITDRQGVVISRDVDPNAEPVGVNLATTYNSVQRALQGNAVRDFWYWHNFLLDVAIAPIHNGGQVVGVLIVGHDISNGVAQADRELFGCDVAYLMQRDESWALHSSSISAGRRRSALREVISAQQEDLTSSMTARTPHYVTIDLTDEEHIALAGNISGSESAVPAGYILLSSVSDVRAPASQPILVLFFAFGGMILVVAIGFFLSSHFLGPVEAIEEGILRIINGDIEHRFEVQSTEFGGLSYRVNQLVAVLTGEEETTEEENGGQS